MYDAVERRNRSLAVIFISYRREDSAGYAGRICQELGNIFGADHVFMDIEDIAPGEDFTKAIESRISECDALVTLIGPQWLSSLRAREQSEDFVRHEIETALKRGITVIPVLISGADMPRYQDLPKSVAQLARYQAVAIRDARFDDDLQVLVDALRSRVNPALPLTQRASVWKVLIPLLVIAVIAGLFMVALPSDFDVNGVWVAEMKKEGQYPYQVRLELIESSGKLSGSVSFPTGDGVIEDGTIQGSKVTFSTTHLPQFASEAAVSRFNGEIVKGEIQLVSVDSNGVAKGIARKRTQ